jgi:hypothetical protein
MNPGAGAKRTFDEARPDHVELFAAFGFASRCAQEFEAIVFVSLHYSLALAGNFASLGEVDRAAEKQGSIPLGQVVSKLTEYLNDDEFRASIEHAISTRNSLVHGFFRKRTAGIAMTKAETADATAWCEAASEEFVSVSRKLHARREDQHAMVQSDPDAVVPGLRVRMEAIERGEWP